MTTYRLLLTTIRRPFAIVAIFLAGLGAPAASAQQAVVVARESRLSIDGTTNVSDFSCRAREIAGAGALMEDAGRTATEARIEIPVHSFDCGNGRMNADLFDALKAGTHPSISFQLERADVVARESNGKTEMDVAGTIRVAGVPRHVRARVAGDELANGQFRVYGAIDLSMSEFDVDPPTALLGLIRVRDAITVRFDLVAATLEAAAAGRSSPGAHASGAGGSN